MIPLLATLLLSAPQDRPAPPDPCAAPAEYAHFLSIQPGPARQGARLRIQPQRGLSYITEEEPTACLSDWRVSNPRAVTLAEDRKSIAIAPDAPAGEAVTISYMAAGKRREAQIRIVAKDAVVLTGTRSQQAIERCRAEAVQELVFSDDGHFSVTFHPFETYKDYWGSYSFEAASAKLTLKIEGGNNIVTAPEQTGTARYDADGKLVLDGFSFGRAEPIPDQSGSVHQGWSCRYTFG